MAVIAAAMPAMVRIIGLAKRKANAVFRPVTAVAAIGSTSPSEVKATPKAPTPATTMPTVAATVLLARMSLAKTAITVAALPMIAVNIGASAEPILLAN